MEDFNPDALSLEDQNTFATLTRALQESLAEAERLRAESERLSALRETLTAQLQSSSEAVALYRSEGASNSKTDETQHVTEVSGFDSKDREEEDEDDDDEDEISPGLGAELLPFIEREMRGIAEQVARLQRGELPPGVDPSDPAAEAAVVSALEKRLEMLTRLDRLAQIERAISTAEATSIEVDDEEREDAKAAVAALPDRVELTNVDGDKDAHDFLSQQAMLAEKEREVANLEAQVAALSAHRDELNRLIETTSSRAINTNQSSHNEVLPTVSKISNDTNENLRTSSSSGVSNQTQDVDSDVCDFSTLDEDSQAIVVQARMQLLSSVLESDTFDGIVKTSIRTMSAPTAEAEYRESLSVSSLRAGAPAFMTIRSVLAVIRSSIRIAAARVLQETTHEIESIEDIIVHSLFVSSFRREVVRLLLKGIPIANQLHDEEDSSKVDSTKTKERNGESSTSAAQVRQQSADEAGSSTDIPPNDQSVASSSSSAKAKPVVAAEPPKPSPKSVIAAEPPKPTPLSAVVSVPQQHSQGAIKNAHPPVLPTAKSTKRSETHTKTKSSASSGRTTKSATEYNNVNSRIDRLAQPNQRYVRSKLVLPSEVKATEEFMATANFYGVKKDGSKLPFRVWPKPQVKSKLAPKREKPSPSKEADERNRMAAQVLGRTSSSSFNTTRNEENFSYADLAMSIEASIENGYVSQHYQNQFESSSEHVRPPNPSASGITPLEILAAGAPAGPPSPRARPGWEIPTYTGASALPQSRVFDATSSSYRVLTERKLHLQRVFPDVEAHYSSLKSSVEASQVPRAKFPAPFGGQDSGKPIPLEVTSRTARTRSTSPSHPAFAASSTFIYRPRSSTGGSHSTLSEQGIAPFDAAAILPVKGDRRSRSSSLTKSEAFGTTLAPRRQGQDGCRHTYIHNVWHKSFTTVSSIKQWARVAGNTTTGQEPFKILHLARPPPPPSSYWYSSSHAPGPVSVDLPSNKHFGSIASELYSVSHGGSLTTSRVESEPYLEKFTSRVAPDDFSSSLQKSQASAIAQSQVDARWGTWDMPPEVEAVLHGSAPVAVSEPQISPKSIEKFRPSQSFQSTTTTSTARSFSFTPTPSIASTSTSSISTFLAAPRVLVQAPAPAPATAPAPPAPAPTSIKSPLPARPSIDSFIVPSLSSLNSLKPQLDIREIDGDEDSEDYVVAAITSARSAISRHASSNSVTGQMTSPTVYDDDDELDDSSGWRKRQFGSTLGGLRPTLHVDEEEVGTQIMNEADVYHDAHVQASITSAREKIASFRIDPKLQSPDSSASASATTTTTTAFVENGVTFDRPSTSRKVPRPSADEFMSYVQSPPMSVKSSISPSTSNSEDQWNIVKEDAKVSDESRGKMSFSSSSKAPLRASQMIGKETNKEEVEVDEDVTDEALEMDEDVSLNSSYTATIIDADKVIEEQRILVSNLKDILTSASVAGRKAATDNDDDDDDDDEVQLRTKHAQDERLRRHYEKLLQIGRAKPLR